MPRASLIALTLAVLAAGCGKASNQQTQTKPAAPTTAATTPAQTTTTTAIHASSGKPLTHAQWVAKGEAICAKLLRQTAPLKFKNFSELPRLLPQEVIYLRSAVTALSKLTPPPDKARDWQTFLNLKNQWIQGVGQLADNPEFSRTLATNPLFRTLAATRLRADKLVQSDGFSHCAYS